MTTTVSTKLNHFSSISVDSRDDEPIHMPTLAIHEWFDGTLKPQINETESATKETLILDFDNWTEQVENELTTLTTSAPAPAPTITQNSTTQPAPSTLATFPVTTTTIITTISNEN